MKNSGIITRNYKNNAVNSVTSYSRIPTVTLNKFIQKPREFRAKYINNAFYKPLRSLNSVNCFHLNCVNNLNSRNEFKTFNIKSVLSGAIFGTDCLFLIDSGANFSAINSKFVPNNALLNPVYINCFSFTGKDIKLKGEINTNIQLKQQGKNIQFKQKFVVSDEFTDHFIILGNDFLFNYKCNLCFQQNKLNTVKGSFPFTLLKNQCDQIKQAT